MPNAHKKTKAIVPARLEREEIDELKQLASERGLTLADFLKAIALGDIPVGDATGNPQPTPPDGPGSSIVKIHRG